MDNPVSIAIETSCRRGGVALGAGEELIETVCFQAGRRHAVQLVARLDELLGRHSLGALDVEEAYVSIGPGSFTGLRIGVAVATTLALVNERLRCVAVPTVEAVAENAAGMDLQHVGVVMDAKDDNVYAGIFTTRRGRVVPEGPPGLISVRTFLAEVPGPITLLGEGLGYHEFRGEGITIADERLWLPTAEGIWRIGRRSASAGRFQQPRRLRPLYLRRPEALRLWEQRKGRG